MLVLAVGSRLITRKLSIGVERSRWQNLLEIVVTAIEKQIEEVGLRHPEKYIGFLGTLFLFIALASLCTCLLYTSIRRVNFSGPAWPQKHTRVPESGLLNAPSVR